MAEAALAMSKAQVRLAQSKDSVAEMKQANERLKRGLNRHNDMHVHAAIHATARAVWNLFKREK
jgi:alanine dehydrogenase